MKHNWKHLLKPAVLAAAALALAACGSSAETSSSAAETTSAEAAESASETSAAGDAAEKTESSAAEEGSAEAASSEASDEKAAAGEEGEYIDDTVLRVGSLKGPTTMGIVNMMAENEENKLPFKAEFTMAAAADEITAKFAGGELDIAMVPSNLASVLYNKTEGKVQVIDINTLGVLYGLTADPSVKSIADLAGRTVYMTGQGSTPQYSFEYLLKENDLEGKVQIEYKSEPTELAALLKEDSNQIVIAPQPFATVIEQQNPDVKVFLDLTKAWTEAKDSGSSQLVTGVTIVNSDFLAEHEALVAEFVLEHQESALKATEDLDTTAELVAKYGIIEKAPIAKLALPKCNIVCLTGADMEDALSGYLDVLYQAEPKSVGGKLPGEDFYAFVDAAE